MPPHSDRRKTQQWAKIGPPRRGCPVVSAGSVASFAGAPGPCCTPRLPSERHRAISVGQSYLITL